MTPLDALATAIRERLLSGHPAPLPGLGMLVRQHVSARVEERPDGTRTLLPPGETIGLAPIAGAPDGLAVPFGEQLGVARDEADEAFKDAVEQVEAVLSATGEVRLPGVGLLRRTSGGVILGVEAGLLESVNRTFQEISPFGGGPATDAEPDTPAPPADSPLAAFPDTEYDDEADDIGDVADDAPEPDAFDAEPDADAFDAAPADAASAEEPPAEDALAADLDALDLQDDDHAPADDTPADDDGDVGHIAAGAGAAALATPLLADADEIADALLGDDLPEDEDDLPFIDETPEDDDFNEGLSATDDATTAEDEPDTTDAFDDDLHAIADASDDAFAEALDEDASAEDSDPDEPLVAGPDDSDAMFDSGDTEEGTSAPLATDHRLPYDRRPYGQGDDEDEDDVDVQGDFDVESVGPDAEATDADDELLPQDLLADDLILEAPADVADAETLSLDEFADVPITPGAAALGTDEFSAEPEVLLPADGPELEEADSEGADSEETDAEEADAEEADAEEVEVAEFAATEETAAEDEAIAPMDEADDLLDAHMSAAVLMDSEAKADGPTESAFVDDDTLDADLDDVLAVPFGAPDDALPDDLLDPTADPEDDSEIVAGEMIAGDDPVGDDPVDVEPLPDQPDDEQDVVDDAVPPPIAVPETTPAEGEDDWLSDTWTATVNDPPPPTLGDAPLIEDAEVVFDDVPATAMPAAELDTLLAAAPPPDDVTVAAPAAPAVAPADDAGSFPWWVLILLALALAVAAVVWLATRSDDEVEIVDPATEETLVSNGDTDEAVPADVPRAAAVDGSLDVPPEGSASAPIDAGGGVEGDAEPAPAPAPAAAPPAAPAGRAPAAGVAILPPRLSGLDATDVRALSGDPVDLDADAWTLVVLSTASSDDARALAVRYRTAGYRAAVIEVPGSQRRWRVAVGQFASRDDALRLRDRLPPQAPADTWPLDLRSL